MAIFLVLLISTLASASSLRTARALTTIYIRADGSIDPVTAPIHKNGDVYTLTANINSDVDGIVIKRNNTVLDGAGYTLQGTGTSNGVHVSGNSYVTIKNLDVKAFEYGILLDTYSTYNTISGNKVEDNDYGINCWLYSDNNSIIGNNISANNLAGIWIAGSSDIAITENIIAANGQYGISLESSSSDIVYHNSFISNTNQVYIYDSIGTWDNGYPSGGNYWSDYTGTDNNHDGIGDTPYTIDSNNQDNNPLMNPWINIAVADLPPTKTIVGQGYSANITIAVQNQGWDAETTNLTIYANTTIISTITNIILPRRSFSIPSFTWQTVTYAIGNYTLNGKADFVPDEIDTRDNVFNVPVHVGVPGDVSSSTPGVYDATVNMKDVAYLVSLFNTNPSSPKWKPNADVNNDGVCNMKDIAVAIAYFNKHE